MRIVNQNLFFSIFLQKNLTRLAAYNPDVLCLQELSINKFKSIKSNPFQNFFAVSPTRAKKSTVGILTKESPVDWGELHLNSTGAIIDTVNPKLFDTVALWVDLKYGTEKLRIYSCYFQLDYIGFLERAAMLETVIEHSAGCKKVLIMGDMNTTIPEGKLNRFCNFVLHRNKLPSYADCADFYLKNEKHFFNSRANASGFLDLLDLRCNTWRIPFTPVEACSLKLDWAFQKNIENAEITLESKTPWYLDHKTIIIDLADSQ